MAGDCFYIAVNKSRRRRNLEKGLLLDLDGFRLLNPLLFLLFSPGQIAGKSTMIFFAAALKMCKGDFHRKAGAVLAPVFGFQNHLFFAAYCLPMAGPDLR